MREGILTQRRRGAESTQRRSFLEVRHFSANPVFEDRHIEIDEQAHRPATQPQIGHKLSFVNGMNDLDCFHFYDDNFRYYQISR